MCDPVRLIFLIICGLIALTNDLAAQTNSNVASGLRSPFHPGAVAQRNVSGALPAGTGSSTASAWITGPLVKVSPNATPGTQQSLQISAAHNEFESFQVHAFANANPIQMNVTVSDFTNSLTGDIIPSASNVFLYREAYLDISTLSDANGTLGVTPDPLIPAIDPYFKQPRSAFPVTVPADQVQSAWIDVLVPPNVASGYYSATVTVLDGTTVVATLSVVLQVWAFTLPSTATLKTAFGMSWDGFCVQAYGSYGNCGQYPGSSGSPDLAIELTHLSQATLLLDHRISISQVVYVGPPDGTWAHFDATYGPLLNGTTGTLLSGAALTELQFTPPGADDLDAPTIQDWVANFTSSGWLGSLFHYTCDEPPNGCSWASALSMEQSVYNASPAMRTLITTNLASATQNNLLADLGIIVPIVNDMEPQGGTNQRSSYDSWLTGTNKHLWWYQSCSSHGSCSNGTVGPGTATWPSYMVDATPVRNRVFQWLAFIDRIEAELYYAIDYCWSSFGCGSNSNSNAPWTSVYAFGGNGDGTLIYPGTPALIGGTTPIPLPSIRLKQIRDGMEDFEYLTALSQAGYDAFARSTAAAFITNAYTFNNDPQALTNAREALGSRLHRLALPACSHGGVCAHDFNGDGFSDIAWRQSGGSVAGWTMNGAQVLQSASVGAVPTSWQIVGQRDFNGDGSYDWLWRDGSGNVALWFMNGLQVSASASLGNVPTTWNVLGTGDFNGDGFGDILWRDSAGNLALWLMNGTTVIQSGIVGNVPTNWVVAGVGDFNGDGKADVLWRDGGSGTVAIWLMNGIGVAQSGSLGVVPLNWSIVGTGDFNGDGKADVLWRDGTTGTVAIWLMNGLQVSQSGALGAVPAAWSIAETGDFNGDGKSDILWRDTGGDVALWFINGLQVSSSALIGTVTTDWTIQSTNAD